MLKISKFCIAMAKAWRQSKNRIVKNVLCFSCLFVLPLLVLTVVVYSKSKHAESLPIVKRPSSQKSENSQKNFFYLIVMIMSDPTKLATREAIRETWLSNNHEEVKHLFVIGSKGLSQDVLQNVLDENSSHGDMVILESVNESYGSLTNKVLAGFQWLHSNHNFSFLLKCDDDSFVLLPPLIKELHKQPQKHLYWGFFKGGSSVFQRGKWKEKDWFLCDTYLPYALGGGYILSSDLVKFIATNALLLQQYKSEDVSVGVWLSPLKIHRVHDVRFDTEFKSRGCYNDYLITHKQSANEMREKQANLTKTGKLCQFELRVRYSYNYNWTALPSQCCKNFDPELP